MQMTYEQKMAAINSLYPEHDWVCIRLDAMMAALLSKRDAHIAAHVDPDNFFSAATCGDGLTPDERALLERLNVASLRRYNQLMRRQDAIRDTFSLDELEQQVIS